MNLAVWLEAKETRIRTVYRILVLLMLAFVSWQTFEANENAQSAQWSSEDANNAAQEASEFCSKANDQAEEAASNAYNAANYCKER